MQRRLPDPWLLGAVDPELRITPEVALLLLPAVRQWVAEHQKVSRAKLEAAAPIIARWEHLAALHRDRLVAGFAGETTGGAVTAGGALSTHGHVEVTAKQAAQRLGCTPQYVGRLCRNGRLESRKVGGAWMVDALSVDLYERGDTAA